MPTDPRARQGALPVRLHRRPLLPVLWLGGLGGLGGLVLLFSPSPPKEHGADAQPESSLPPPPSAAPPRVRVTTNMGEFVIELMPDRVPMTAANFLRYVKEGYYSGTLIHRVIANFVIQGGGHQAADYKLKPAHEPVFNESGSGLQNKRGTVGLARGEPPHSGNAQFYINLVDNPDLDPLPTRWGYAVFGKIVEGMDVVDRIGVTPTGAMGPFKSDAPLKPVIIEKAVLLEAGVPTPPSIAPKPGNAPPPTILSPK
jgi:peptidyl-prolyl cis-trans isomerase A (cyclophilin A)